ncbi:MAG: hypothetical protein R3C19_15610 [Planctomycetaceae bacterium]
MPDRRPASREPEAFIEKCILKAPEDRFQSPDKLLDVLESYDNGEAWTWKVVALWWSKHYPEFVQQEAFDDACSAEIPDRTDWMPE